ncbi:MAG: DUF4139 domain-containing protein [Dysgonomonas sp.]
MKTKLIFIAIMLLTGLPEEGNANEKKTIKAQLDEATVFFQGAELTHSATANLIRGENEVWIEGLSPNIDKNSLKIKTSNGAVISSFEYSVDYLFRGKTENEATKKIQDSIDIYKQKLSLLETDIKVNAELSDILKKSTDKNTAGLEKGIGIEELIRTMDYYKKKSTELQNTQRNNQLAQAELQKSIAKLEAQLRQESTKNNKTSGILKLTLSSPTTVAANFTINYYTVSASWTPSYDINVISTDKPIKIVSKAKVRQITGLDWSKVKLSLSSGTPSNGKVAPLFSVWFLQQAYALGSGSVNRSSLQGMMMQNSYSYSDAMPAGIALERSVPASSSKDSKAPLYIVDGTPVEMDYFNSIDPSMIKNNTYMDSNDAIKAYGSEASGGAYIISLKSGMDDYVSVADNDLNMTFNIDLPYSIPGNGKEQSIELTTKEINAEYKYYCAPKLDIETYLLAEISDWQKLNLLSGKANITYDGTYVGESFINANSTQSKLSLTLGTDKRVAVKREKMNDYSSTKFLGSDVKQLFTYKITVKNNQNKAIKMVLKDQYPRSQAKGIDVELLKETTPWTANVEELGVITWEENINSGDNKVYYISYSVKYPKGSNLNL